MTKKGVFHWLRQPVSRVHALAAFLIIVSLFGIGGMIVLHTQRTLPSPSSHYTTNPYSANMVRLTPTPHDPFYIVSTFTSPDLGISFNYRVPNNTQGQQWVREIGDKVYIGPLRENGYPTGKYVQVFSKDPQDSITEAITKRFLHGYSKQDCLIETYTDPHEPATYQYADIRVPTAENDSLTRFMDKSAKCPPDTVSGNSNIYFLMDTAHADKLLYFNLGQDNFGSGIHMRSGSTDIELSWDESIKFPDGK